MRLTKGLKKLALPVSCRASAPGAAVLQVWGADYQRGCRLLIGVGSLVRAWQAAPGGAEAGRGLGGAPAAATAPTGGLLDWASELCREQKKGAPEVSLMLVHVNGQHGMQHDTATSGHR